MTLRRYSEMKPSAGTVIPPAIRLIVLRRDDGCIGESVGMPGPCLGPLELDHVRASHGMGMKSETTPANLVTLCGTHHRVKTNGGRIWRPVLLAYLEQLEDPHATHVDPVQGCDACYRASNWPVDHEYGE